MRPFPPLATLYVAANLRHRGHEVAVFDAMLAPDESHFSAALDRHRPDAVVLYEDNFNFLSKMCLGRMRHAALTMVAAARMRGLPVIVSGSDMTDHPDLYLAAGAGAVAIGEGDHTVAEWVDWLAAGPMAGQRPDHLAGLVLAVQRRCNSACSAPGRAATSATPTCSPIRRATWSTSMPTVPCGTTATASSR
jgi:anaerobic magnesium-protoporphyrin IX monomethyl ester cyclase